MSEMEELQAAIDELRDIEALKALKCRYCHLVDARRWDELLELWTEDAVLGAGAMTSQGPRKHEGESRHRERTAEWLH